MNGEITLEQERPRVINDVADDRLHDLLAALAHKGAWVLSMERKGAVYSLQVSWRGENEADQI